MSPPMNRDEILSAVRSVMCRSNDVSAVLAIRHGDHSFSLAAKDTKRLELLGQVRSGEGTPVELEIDIRGFQQQEGVANRNFSRFKKGILRKLAKSFKGVPLLRDHDQGSIEARAGTVLESKAVPIEGGLAFDMTARVTAPWAVEAVLAGNLDRFSIGWDFPGLDTLQCSACKCQVLTGDCFHFPGDRLEDGGRAEFIFTEAEGVEVSGVSVPAVKGTGLDQVRSALSTAAGLRLDKHRDESAEENMLKIARTLGLKDDADESTIVAGIGALKARAEAAETTLATERVSHQENLTELATANKRISELEAAGTARDVDALCSEFSTRFPITRDDGGKVVTSALETQIRTLAKSDIKAARAMLSAMPEQRPAVGEVPQVLRVSGTPAEKPEDYVSDISRKQRAQLGLTEEDHKNFNQVDGLKTAHLRESN